MLAGGSKASNTRHDSTRMTLDQNSESRVCADPFGHKKKAGGKAGLEALGD
jgi:hypothetical protein